MNAALALSREGALMAPMRIRPVQYRE